MSRTHRLASSALILLIAAAISLPRAVAQGTDRYAAPRKKMVEEAVVGAGVKDPRVIKAMLQTPRHEFVSLNLRPRAYFDMALPIGEQQTISSPFIVAYMTESIDPQPGDKVLEIGTGSGFQAAVLSPLVKEVYTIEIVPELGRGAARVLRRLGYENVSVKVGDGFQGWAEHAPFDKIIVTCSPEKVPQPLVDQLREGGRMVIPVGQRYQQTLYLFTKKDGQLRSEPLRPTLFVPMTGRAEDARRVKPDPNNPSLVNRGFEEDPGESEHVPGWYYQRQQSYEKDVKAPEGNHFLTFRNKEEGRASHALQGFAVDGRNVPALEVSAWVKSKDVIWGEDAGTRPMVVVTLYDDQRRELGSWWIGPWAGDHEWHEKKRTFRIPVAAREGIVRIGLFGALGEISFDNVQVRAAKR